MKIYKFMPDMIRYDVLIMKPKVSIDLIRSFDGRTQAETWQSILLGRTGERDNLTLSDFPGFDLPLVSERAVNLLEKRLHGLVEFLPVETERDIATKYYVMNVIKVVDAINRDKSKFVCFSDGKRILAFQKYAFYSEQIEGIDIFKIPDEVTRKPFVSESLVEFIRSSGLSGLECELVWEG